MAMIEAELGLLQVQIERSAGHAVELRQAPLGVAPEAFNAIDMHRAASELVGAVADPKVLVKAHVHQAVIAAPAVGMDDAGNVGLAPDDGLQCALGGIGHDLGVNTVSALEQPEHHGLRPAPRPRKPRTRLGPKYDSSASNSPTNGERASQCSAMRARMRR